MSKSASRMRIRRAGIRTSEYRRAFISLATIVFSCCFELVDGLKEWVCWVVFYMSDGK